MTNLLDSAASLFLALGPPAIIVAGIATTWSLAKHWKGTKRWLLLTLSPAAIIVTIVLLVKIVSKFTDEGSGFVIGGAALALFMVAAAYIYYPLVFIVGIVRWVRVWRCAKAAKLKETDG